MSKFLIDILLATAPLLSTYFYCRSNRRTAALLLLQRASSIGLLPLRSFMFVEAPCINSTSMASVLLNRAATCRAVEWISPLRLFTSAPLLNNNSVTSVLFFLLHVGVLPNQTYPHYQPALQHRSFPSRHWRHHH